MEPKVSNASFLFSLSLAVTTHDAKVHQTSESLRLPVTNPWRLHIF
jgi:hypothetical protein